MQRIESLNSANLNLDFQRDTRWTRWIRPPVYFPYCCLRWK